MNRRSFLGSTATAFAASGVFQAQMLRALAAPYVEAGPVVEVENGKLRGFRRGEVHIFRGIPYAGSLKPGFRFAEAPTPEPWSGVRTAYGYGPTCPSEDRISDDSTIEWPFLVQRGPVTVSQEDCLRINIWSKGLNDGHKRPVMLWLHAQGFGGGSSQHFLANDGENLARQEDVVVASINHRVGVLGYADLSQVPGADENSGNMGMLDIVTALRWIKRNIAVFGGDPDNVTIFGQSGGAFKVSVLMAMPAAQGLFHKAIIQSGARARVHTRETGAALTAALLNALELPKADIAALRGLSVERLIAAGRDAARAVASTSAHPPDFSPPPWFWQPVAGVSSLPDQPFDLKAPRFSAGVPLIVGNTLHEFPRSVDAPQLEAMSWAEAVESARRDLGARAATVLAGIREDHSGIRPIEAIAIASGRNFRMGAVRLASLRAQSDAAPSWNYIFQWQTPVFEGRPRAFHGLDVPFVFANTDLCDQATGGGPRPRVLASVMAATWARFARTGNPNGKQLPNWPAFTPENSAAMLFEDDSHVAFDPDPSFRKALMTT